MTARPLEEVDGNVEMDSTGPTVKARSLKRKLTSPGEDESNKGRSVARRLEFSKHTPGSWWNKTNRQDPVWEKDNNFTFARGVTRERLKYETDNNYYLVNGIGGGENKGELKQGREARKENYYLQIQPFFRKKNENIGEGNIVKCRVVSWMMMEKALAR